MNNYKNLDVELKIIAKWNQYIMWALRDEGDTDLYYDYTNMRYWFVDKMIDNNVLFTDLPDVNSNNSEMFWFECDKNLDKESFKNIKTHEFDIKTINGKITAVA